MKKTYRVKVTKRAWLEIEADQETSQQEIYELAKEKAKGRIKWEDPTFNIISINIDDTVKDVDVKAKVSLLKAVDPLLNK